MGTITDFAADDVLNVEFQFDDVLDADAGVNYLGHESVDGELRFLFEVDRFNDDGELGEATVEVVKIAMPSVTELPPGSVNVTLSEIPR